MVKSLKLFEKSDIILCERNGLVEGFIIYHLRDNDILIQTFNLRKFNNRQILQNLLKKIFQNLSNSSLSLVTSQCHVTNQRSLNFHHKMGFKIISSNNQTIKLQVNKNHLLGTIQQRYPKK